MGMVTGEESVAERVLGDRGVLAKATGLWKMGKVALNPPSQVRNMVSNMVLLHLSGVPARRLYSGELVVRAIKELRNNGPHWQIARRYGVTKASFAANEMIDIAEGSGGIAQPDGWRLVQGRHANPELVSDWPGLLVLRPAGARNDDHKTSSRSAKRRGNPDARMISANNNHNQIFGIVNGRVADELLSHVAQPKCLTQIKSENIIARHSGRIAEKRLIY